MTTIKKQTKQMESKNYIIDGDVDGVIENDFFSQLKHTLTQHEDSKDDDNLVKLHEENHCLLTKEPLHSIHVELMCGHKFNYIPLYREVIMQKTIGLSQNGYYTLHSLKRNEIKCPYCRNVQDKLLPYIEYDGVKKTYGVNYPTKMSMTSQLCTHSHVNNSNSKKCKKNASCKEFASECHNGMHLCKKHYHAHTTSPPVETPPLETPDTTHICGVILRYGKNKGKMCTNSSTCRIHLNKIKIENQSL
jgi:hypothetical protein